MRSGLSSEIVLDRVDLCDDHHRLAAFPADRRLVVLNPVGPASNPSAQAKGVRINRPVATRSKNARYSRSRPAIGALSIAA
jgi:hypothetical protein